MAQTMVRAGRGAGSRAGQRVGSGAAWHLRAGAGAVAAVLGLAGCEPGRELDWDLRRGGFSTAEAARSSAGRRPQPDSRGVITYPGYQVAVAQRGETVRQMAARLGIDAAELARTNALDPGATLRGGETLVLPGGAAVAAAPAPAGIASAPIGMTPLDAPAGAGTAAVLPAGSEPLRHTVQRGETAFTIARLYDVPARTIAEWNGLPADLSVREGQVLLIPRPQSIAAAAAGQPAAAPASLPAPVVPEPAPLPPPVAPAAPTAAAPAAAAPAPAPAPAQPARPPAGTSAPGQGTPTPTPPSASQPLPQGSPAPAGQGAAAATTPPVADMGAQRTQRAQLAMPVQGRIIRAYQRGRNDGIGIGAPAGTEVRAAAAGTVAAITRDTDQVPILVIRHDGNLLTVYANIDNIRVERGARVSRGQVIATVRRGDPPFLHFEVREGFDSVDPMPYLQ